MPPPSSRFLHLERARADTTPEGQVRLENGGRFESVTGPGEPSDAPPPTVPQAHVERFKLHGQTPLALDDTPGEARTFSRCVGCQTENGRFTQTCTGCGADLQAPEQRTADAERKEEHQRAEVRMHERMRTPPALTPEQEAPLRQALEQDRSLASRIAPLFTPSLGVGLLRLIPHPLARWMAAVWAVALPVLLMRSGSVPLLKLGAYVGAFVLVSFVPTAFWRAGNRHRE